MFSKFIVSYSFFLGFSARKKDWRENFKRKDKKGIPEKRKKKEGSGERKSLNREERKRERKKERGRKQGIPERMESHIEREE